MGTEGEGVVRYHPLFPTSSTSDENELDRFPMNPSPELAPQLKQLRLSGIFDSLEARNRQDIGRA